MNFRSDRMSAICRAKSSHRFKSLVSSDASLHRLKPVFLTSRSTVEGRWSSRHSLISMQVSEDQASTSFPPQTDESSFEDSQEEYGWVGGAAIVADFCEAIPELDEEVVSLLIRSNPSVLSIDPLEARGKLQGISSGLGIDLSAAARFVGKVPEAWERPSESLVGKISLFATELLGSSGAEDLSLIVGLISSQPFLWSVNTPIVIKDRFEGLAEKLRISIRKVILLMGKQPMFWMIKPGQVKSSITTIQEKLGLDEANALDLIAKMPVVISLEPSLLVLGVNGLASTMGVPVTDLIDLLSKSLGLIAIPAEVLGKNLEVLSSLFEVDINKVIDLVVKQPTLLATQAANIANAIDLVSTSLRVNRSTALDLIIRQPGLLYDFDQAAIDSRIDALSKTFLVDVDEMRGLVVEQPDLLIITPNTIRAALSSFTGEQMEEGSGNNTLASSLSLLVQNPGAFVLLGYMGDVIEQWVSRLGLEEETLNKLVARHPSLLEMSPSTVKARLEGLSALFSIPLEISASLVMKHPALAVIPPNATITKAKGMSMAFGCSMQMAATMMAKEPGVLSCCASPPGELNRDLKPYIQAIQEVSSYYEFYTMEWINQTIRNATPTKNTSFQQIQERG